MEANQRKGKMICQLVQSKNELRRKRDRATGPERDALHLQYKSLRTKVKALRKSGNKKVVEKLEKEQGSDPSAYWRQLKKLTNLDKPKEKLPGKMRLGNDWVTGLDTDKAWIEEFARCSDSQGRDSDISSSSSSSSKSNRNRHSAS